MRNRTSREKIALDPLTLLGLILSLVTVTAGAVWFIIQRVENSEILLLKDQVRILEDQIKIRNQEVQEKTDVLQQISTVAKNNEELTSLITKVLKERIGIIGPREIWINEAVLLPETNITIAYENIANYPTLRNLLNIIPIIRKWIYSPNILTINSGQKGIINNLFPRAGAEVQFQHNNTSYRLIILAVREKNIRISVFKDISKN